MLLFLALSEGLILKVDCPDDIQTQNDELPQVSQLVSSLLSVAKEIDTINKYIYITLDYGNFKNVNAVLTHFIYSCVVLRSSRGEILF